MHWDSVLSTPNAKYCTGNISNMYIMSMLHESEYVCFRVDMIPKRIFNYYNLHDMVHDGYVYARVNKAWYKLKQAGKIAHDNLVQHLHKHGYVKAGHTNGLFKHITRDISFTLVVDDFGIKYTSKEDIAHLIKIMQLKYKFKVNFEAEQYIGINMIWDYNRREVRCSMDGYVKQALIELEHIPSDNRHHAAPSAAAKQIFGSTIQYVYDDDSDPVDED